MENSNNKKPSNFTNYPWSSIFHKTEHEVIAVNIMKILSRTGDEFRPIDWEEYKSERLKDGHFSEKEKKYFQDVIPYCESESKAKTFSHHWNF
ncbi:hypothetical protein ABE425_14760 [Chryseobacterium cucumeris]|uniref:hypothetical protein n=1 Tax=Chryseobacterium cucumeris TaxID=1813611 RepID=UPI00320AD20B